MIVSKFSKSCFNYYSFKLIQRSYCQSTSKIKNSEHQQNSEEFIEESAGNTIPKTMVLVMTTKMLSSKCFYSMRQSLQFLLEENGISAMTFPGSPGRIDQILYSEDHKIPFQLIISAPMDYKGLLILRSTLYRTEDRYKKEEIVDVLQKLIKSRDY